MSSMIEKLVMAGYPRKEMYHHYSDLYVFITPVTIKVVDEWFKEQHDYFNTKDRLNYFYGSSCDLGCSGDSCQWGSSDGQTIDFDPESIK